MDDSAGNFLKTPWAIEADDAVVGRGMNACCRCQNKVLCDHRTTAVDLVRANNHNNMSGNALVCRRRFANNCISWEGQYEKEQGGSRGDCSRIGLNFTQA